MVALKKEVFWNNYTYKPCGIHRIYMYIEIHACHMEELSFVSHWTDNSLGELMKSRGLQILPAPTLYKALHPVQFRCNIASTIA